MASRLLALLLVLEQGLLVFTSNASNKFGRYKKQKNKYQQLSPTNKAIEKLCIASPPATNNTTNTNKVVNDVIKVRPSVWLIDFIDKVIRLSIPHDTEIFANTVTHYNSIVKRIPNGRQQCSQYRQIKLHLKYREKAKVIMTS